VSSHHFLIPLTSCFIILFLETFGSDSYKVLCHLPLIFVNSILITVFPGGIPRTLLFYDTNFLIHTDFRSAIEAGSEGGKHFLEMLG